MEEELHPENYHIDLTYDTELSKNESEAANDFLKGDREYNLDKVAFNNVLVTEIGEDSNLSRPDRLLEDNNSYGFSINGSPK